MPSYPEATQVERWNDALAVGLVIVSDGSTQMKWQWNVGRTSIMKRDKIDPVRRTNYGMVPPVHLLQRIEDRTTFGGVLLWVLAAQALNGPPSAKGGRRC